MATSALELHTVTKGRWSDAADPRLGRNINHDSRSRRYAVRPDRTVAYNDVLHSRRIPIFEQGSLGSCTGNAALGALGCDPHFDFLNQYASAHAHGLDWTEKVAQAIYSKATTLDAEPQQWPPTDTGSDGLSAAKAVQELGWISGYQHAFTFTAFMTALQSGPVMVGTNWYSSMFDTDSEGIVRIGTGAYVAGGHEWLVRGFDAARDLLIADNSWGKGWGFSGSFYVESATMRRLLDEQGDATLLVPLNAPAPQPIPDPTPIVPTPVPPESPFRGDLLALANGTRQWRDSKVGLGSRAARQALGTFLVQYGVN